MNKKKQESIARKNRIRTRNFQEAAKRNRERKVLMHELNQMEAAEQAQMVEKMNANVAAEHG